MRTVENPADPVCQLVGREQPLGLYHLALAVDPLGLHRVEPRALDGQEADDDPYSLATVLDSSVVRGNPPSYLFGDVPGGVVPDQHPNLLARRPKLLAAPRQKAGAYPAHGAAIRETYPHILQLGHIKPVAGDGLRIGIVFLDRSFDEAQGLTCFAPAIEGRPRQAAEPALVQEVQETRDPLGASFGQADQSVAPPVAPPFSRVLGIGRSDPPLGSLPTHPHPRQPRPDGFSSDALFGQALLEADLGG